jgi:hypothetical protein
MGWAGQRSHEARIEMIVKLPIRTITVAAPGI